MDNNTESKITENTFSWESVYFPENVHHAQSG